MNREQGLRSKRSPFLLLALGCLWGSSWIATTSLASSLRPLATSALRFLLAAALCGPFLFFRRSRLPRGRALAACFLLSLTLVTFPTAMLVWVQSQLPSATVVVLFSAMPLLLSLGAPSTVMRASTVVVGVLAFAFNFSFSWAQVIPSAAGLAAVALIAQSSLAVRRELGGENAVAVTALLLGPAGLLLGVASLVWERPGAISWNGEMLLSLFFLGAVAGTGGYVTYIWLLQRMEAYQVATMQWIEPVAAVLESACFVRVVPSWRILGAAAVTFVCLILVLTAQPQDDEPVSLLGDRTLKVG